MGNNFPGLLKYQQLHCHQILLRLLYHCVSHSQSLSLYIVILPVHDPTAYIHLLSGTFFF